MIDAVKNKLRFVFRSDAVALSAIAAPEDQTQNKNPVAVWNPTFDQSCEEAIGKAEDKNEISPNPNNPGSKTAPITFKEIILSIRLK